jgi:short-subunit dehydrogenase
MLKRTNYRHQQTIALNGKSRIGNENMLMACVNSIAAAPQAFSYAQSGLAPYFTSKCAMQGLLKTVWADVRERGIKVATLYPGLVGNALGRRGGVVPLDRSALIADDDVARALLFALDSPTNSCATHVVLSEQRASLRASSSMLASVEAAQTRARL